MLSTVFRLVAAPWSLKHGTSLECPRQSALEACFAVQSLNGNHKMLLLFVEMGEGQPQNTPEVGGTSSLVHRHTSV